MTLDSDTVGYLRLDHSSYTSENASIYKMMVAMEDIKDKSPDLLSKKEQKLCEQGIREMRDYLDGKEVSDT